MRSKLSAAAGSEAPAVRMRGSLASDASSLHHAHYRHCIPQIITAWRPNVAVGQLLGDFAIWHLPHFLQDRPQDRVTSRCRVGVHLADIWVAENDAALLSGVLPASNEGTRKAPPMNALASCSLRSQTSRWLGQGTEPAWSDKRDYNVDRRNKLQFPWA